MSQSAEDHESMGNDCLDIPLNRRRFVAAAVGLLAGAPIGPRAQAQSLAAADAPDAALNLLIESNTRTPSIRRRVMATRHAVPSRPRPNGS